MLKGQAGDSVELPHQIDKKYLEHHSCETVREVYQTLDRSGLDQFTFSFIDSLQNDLTIVFHELDSLPEPALKKLMGVIYGLREARNEMQLACFLFDVQEINAVHRLIMRNRAVLRSKTILQKILKAWPFPVPHEHTP